MYANATWRKVAAGYGSKSSGSAIRGNFRETEVGASCAAIEHYFLKEWEAENSALQNRLQNALSEREVLTSELIDLKNLNHAFKILHENDMNEYDCLANAVEDLSFAIRTLTGVTSESQPDDNIQQLSSVSDLFQFSAHLTFFIFR